MKPKEILKSCCGFEAQDVKNYAHEWRIIKTRAEEGLSGLKRSEQIEIKALGLMLKARGQRRGDEGM